MNFSESEFRKGERGMKKETGRICLILRVRETIKNLNLKQKSKESIAPQ